VASIFGAYPERSRNEPGRSAGGRTESFRSGPPPTSGTGLTNNGARHPPTPAKDARSVLEGLR